MRLALSVEGSNISFFVRDGADISALREIFAEGEYSFDMLPPVTPRHIADLGAHIGTSVLYFHTIYPQARITAYEPDPENFKLLLKNVSALPQIECVNAAVAGTAGTVLFHQNIGSSTRSSLARLDGSNEGIEVASMRFDDVIQDGVDFVKFDIEGAEDELFSAASPEDIRKVSRYVGEFHHYLIPKTNEEFERLFPGFTSTWKSRGHNVSIVAILPSIP